MIEFKTHQEKPMWIRRIPSVSTQSTGPCLRGVCLGQSCCYGMGKRHSRPGVICRAEAVPSGDAPPRCLAGTTRAICVARTDLHIHLVQKFTKPDQTNEIAFAAKLLQGFPMLLNFTLWYAAPLAELAISEIFCN